MSKNCQKLDIISKEIAIGNFFLKKKENFWQFFGKYVMFLAVFLHSNGNFPESQNQGK